MEVMFGKYSGSCELPQHSHPPQRFLREIYVWKEASHGKYIQEFIAVCKSETGMLGMVSPFAWAMFFSVSKIFVGCGQMKFNIDKQGWFAWTCDGYE